MYIKGECLKIWVLEVVQMTKAKEAKTKQKTH